MSGDVALGLLVPPDFLGDRAAWSLANGLGIDADGDGRRDARLFVTRLTDQIPPTFDADLDGWSYASSDCASIEGAARDVAVPQPSVISYASVSGSCFRDREACEAMAAGARTVAETAFATTTDVPRVETCTAFGALVGVLKMMELSRVAIIAPRLGATSNAADGYWQERFEPAWRSAGFGITDVAYAPRVPNRNVSQAQVLDFARTVVQKGSPQAVVIATTEMPVPAVSEFELETGIPIIHALTATIATSLRLSGIEPGKHQRPDFSVAPNSTAQGLTFEV